MVTITAESLEEYLSSLGFPIELLSDPSGIQYTVIKSFEIPIGPLKGKICDVAIQRILTIPYTTPAAIHTRPHLVPMSPGVPLGTQPSSLGDDWQYWSRRYDKTPTPSGIWAHILGVLTRVPL